MKVRVQPSDEGGCGHYRMIWPAQHLASVGEDVDLAFSWPMGAWYRSEWAHDVEGLVLPVGHMPEELRAVDLPDDLDVLVLQRVMDRQWYDAIPVVQAQGTAVVVEIDDDFHSLPATHPSRFQTAVRYSPDVNRMFLRKACAIADLVTATTPALLERYAPHGRGIVLPNYVPERFLSIDADEHEGVVIGWTGSTQSHVDDLRVCGTGVRDAMRDAIVALHPTPVSFDVVGTGVQVAKQLQLDEVNPCGFVEITDYPHQYAQFDVAIAPLQPSEFNEAKSWLKVLEAAALGVPVVASPTSEYQRAADLGMCTLAATPGAWREQVAGLAINHTGRMWQAQQARQAAAEFTVERNAWRWQEAWEQAVEFHRARKQAA